MDFPNDYVTFPIQRTATVVIRYAFQCEEILYLQKKLRTFLSENNQIEITSSGEHSLSLSGEKVRCEKTVRIKSAQKEGKML